MVRNHGKLARLTRRLVLIRNFHSNYDVMPREMTVGIFLYRATH